LLIEPETVTSYLKLYQSGGVEALCSFQYEGRARMLSEEELSELSTELRARIYLCTQEVIAYKEYLKTSRIKILFLPPYAPNLNLIERLWKFFKKNLLYNRYYETFRQFRSVCLEFFNKLNLKRLKKQLTFLLTP
jgi:transposase